MESFEDHHTIDSSSEDWVCCTPRRFLELPAEALRPPPLSERIAPNNIPEIPKDWARVAFTMCNKSWVVSKEASNQLTSDFQPLDGPVY